MHDTEKIRPDLSCLFDVASGQHGYFTTAQARACGLATNLVRYHVDRGRFIPTYRGVYHLRDYPSSPYEEVAAAWLAVGKDKALVSHESALDLLELSNVSPNAIHLTVPRSKRYTKSPAQVVVHTTTRPLERRDTTMRHGIGLTGPVRTILDAAEYGTSPDQIEMAIGQALDRALILPSRLLREAETYAPRVAELIQTTLDRRTG